MRLSKIIFHGVLLLISFSIAAQEMSWEEYESMPEPVTNNAVTCATVNGVPFIYSFSGLDESKDCGKNHLRSFRFDTSIKSWEVIGDLPDPKGGKIAAAASTVKNKIYIIGGYHISNSCNEISSKKVSIYDPETNSYLVDGADIPKAIDDHVQAVYRDSLIYLITGWSNTTNVVDVQIYNPSADVWLQGTSVPNDPEWRVFGASGTIVGDTIYYLGGAKYTCVTNACFEPSQILRKGYINPNDPTDITWTSVDSPQAKGYRMGASVFEDEPFWFGGSELTYNFDGIDYNGTGGVSPLDRLIYLKDGKPVLTPSGFPAIMDMRGLAKIDFRSFMIVGGMLADQIVSDRTILIKMQVITNTDELSDNIDYSIFPNPVDDYLHIESIGANDINLYSLGGTLVFRKEIKGNAKIDVSVLETGVYILCINDKVGNSNYQKLIVH